MTIGFHVAIGDQDQLGAQCRYSPGGFRELGVVADQQADTYAAPLHGAITVAGQHQPGFGDPEVGLAITEPDPFRGDEQRRVVIMPTVVLDQPHYHRHLTLTSGLLDGQDTGAVQGQCLLGNVLVVQETGDLRFGKNDDIDTLCALGDGVQGTSQIVGGVAIAPRQLYKFELHIRTLVSG
ncbi:hypothetical protein D3C81_1423420 [compost metagenome]